MTSVDPKIVSRLRGLIRDVPDFPKPGILFRDITPLLGDYQAMRDAINQICNPHRDAQISKVLGIESRGFLVGALAAVELGVGFVPVRKAGKLPAARISETYALEYGEDCLEVHSDAVRASEKVLVVDDLLATGGTASATVTLARRLGAQVVACAFLIELSDLGGRKRLPGIDVLTLIRY